MTMPDGEFEIDLEEDENWASLENGEQNLEDEANQLLKSWDRELLKVEILDRYKKIESDNQNLSIIYDGKMSFDTLSKSMNAICGNEVFVKVLEPNELGREIQACNSILYDYTGFFEYDTKPFESTVHEGKPKRLNLAEGPIIPGLLNALLSLREGERANVLVKSSQAYGPLGTYNSDLFVPPDADLLYQMKIYKVWDESQLDQVLEYEREYRTEIPIEKKLSLVEEHKQIANRYLNDDQPKEALIRYKVAIKLLDDELTPQVMSSHSNVSYLMTVLLQNASIAYNKLGMHNSASKTAKRALYIDPTSVKAYYQLIKARIATSDFSSATKWLEKADRAHPNNSVFDSLRVELGGQLSMEKQKRKEIMVRMSRAYQ